MFHVKLKKMKNKNLSDCLLNLNSSTFIALVHEFSKFGVVHVSSLAYGIGKLSIMAELPPYLTYISTKELSEVTVYNIINYFRLLSDPNIQVKRL